MLKVDYERWGQSTEILRQEALRAPHPRTRERLMALYEISKGKSATKVGKATGRNPQTVMSWVHCYNEKGSDSVEFQHTGGHPPLCQKSLSQN